MEAGLFEEIDDQIDSIENIHNNDEVMVFKVRMKNGEEFFMPLDTTIDIREVIDKLLSDMKFMFPMGSEDIRVFCEDIITSMTYYYKLKVFKRLLYMSNRGDETVNDILKQAETRLKKQIGLAARLSPLWFGHEVYGLPRYTGDNPYNIHGVDHKYDYLLKENQRYFSNRRDLILLLAISRNPVDISEQYLISCTPLINAVNDAKLANKPPARE